MLSSPLQKDMGILESAQQRAAEMVKELEQLFCEERLREVGVFWKRGGLGHLFEVCEYLSEG